MRQIGRMILLGMALTFAACGPSRKMVRAYIGTSAHRSLAILPPDFKRGEQNNSRNIAVLMERKLQRAGFLVADSSKADRVTLQHGFKNRLFDNAKGASEVGEDLGVQAVLVAIVDDTFDRVERQPAIIDWVPIQPRACCRSAAHPCVHEEVFDPMIDAYVDNCEVPTHRKVLRQPERRQRVAGLSMRVQLFEVPTGKMLWEGRQEDLHWPGSLYDVTDRLTDTLTDQILETYFTAKL